MARMLPVVLIMLAAGWPVTAEPKLRKVESKYYTIHSDLDAETVREAQLRMEHMAEEYYQRTKSFSGRITKKLPFYLFSRPEDYYAAGGMPGTAGVYNGQRLMAIAGPQATRFTWHTVQHEGFHQFVHHVIGGEIPPWVNEGLAEYFGESIFTGDGFVSGVIPTRRLERIKRMIADGKAKGIGAMMRLQHGDWNLELTGENYDQAWSMVHFLAHAENGRYQKPFTAFMKAVGGGADAQQAWDAHFGRGAGAFEAAWRKYWTELPEHPTADRYGEATVSILTSFLARAAAQRQKFVSAADFIEQAKAGTLQCGQADWLPASLLQVALPAAATAGKWSLDAGSKRQPRLILTTPDGLRFEGTFVLKGARVDKVTVRRGS